MRANYGIDAPGVVLYLLTAGFGCIALVFVPGIGIPWTYMLIGCGSAWVLTGSTMIAGSKIFKLKLRDRLLDSLELTGSEHVLDVGCGRGLLLIGAAKRVPNGKAVGIDLWKGVDLLGNSEKATLKNAKIENVEERVEIETADMRRMPFEHQSFDCVVSSWAIHNISSKEDRHAAILEAVRVLKPGGKLLIVDIGATKDYEYLLRGLRMDGVTISKPNFMFLMPSRTVRAVKPIRSNVEK